MEESFFNENNAAWYAAFLSTILLGKEIYDWYKTRPSFDVSFFNTDEPGADDKIIIYNASSRIYSIVAIELYSATNAKSEDRMNYDIGRNTDFNIVVINPLQPFVMYIPDGYKFRIKKEKLLFAEIYILGQKDPIIKEVH